jgi:hypothetical protein
MSTNEFYLFRLFSYGDIYPMSQLARFIAMFASPLSIMMLSVPLSSIYRKYTSICDTYRMQITMPEHIRYLVHDQTGTIGQHSRLQRRAILDVTERINRILKHFD